MAIDTILYAITPDREQPILSVSVNDPDHDDLIAEAKSERRRQARMEGQASIRFRVVVGDRAVNKIAGPREIKTDSAPKTIGSDDAEKA